MTFLKIIVQSYRKHNPINLIDLLFTRKYTIDSHKRRTQLLLDFRIHTFIAVCQHMNFTSAAKHLHITQPTVTQHIQYLENLYQTPLFLYQNRKLTLTCAGEELLRASLSMSNDEAYLKERIQNLSKQRSKLSLGATLTIGEFLFTEQLNKFITLHPDMDVHVTIDNTQVLLNLIDQGTIEFAAIEGFHPKADYDSLTFATIPFIAVCKHDFDLPNTPLEIEDLLSKRLLVREPGSGTRNMLEHYLSDHNLEINDFLHQTEVNNFAIIKKLIVAGRGISFLYKSAVEQELASGLLREIKINGFDITHNFSFVWRKGSIYESEYQQFFHELLKG